MTMQARVSNATSGNRPAVRCRTIAGDDLDAVIALLGRGFPDRTEAYWRTGFARQARLVQPGETCHYGYLLDHGGAIVGVLLTIHAPIAGRPARCNLSSWYVEPDYRGYGVLLDTVAMRDRQTTYVNISPAPQTIPIHEQRGFRPTCDGQAVILPAFSRRLPGQTVRAWSEAEAAALPAAQAEMMRHHVEFGCLGLVCSNAEGTQPVILLPRRLKLREHHRAGFGLPCMQLIYGPSSAEIGPWAGAIGRYLLRHHAMPWMLVDADGPVPGAVGKYFPGRKRKYARGQNRPAQNDLSYTELVIFGA